MIASHGPDHLVEINTNHQMLKEVSANVKAAPESCYLGNQFLIGSGLQDSKGNHGWKADASVEGKVKDRGKKWQKE